ncbi:hypothetical protein [Tepidibacter formicigenes]|jgi:NOL1/NOP2/fmu family ribosome biogenesis protein|uniref:Uncharacterized protein n=1 Tax=Tepidibacter formicigenes DSM 15518 TaxID=1123349 RepID=A0A1M6SS14_9FIRM|nr:hypothetical protein [Tepidibacter formicigenes]SHK47430.1 hypothetical protein SAMN02744037_02414 [Tepidibacter formicigenes DSM 15518]
MKKRINLSFDLEREEDRVVYDLIQSNRGKTKFVIDAVLAFENKREGIDIEQFKNAVKEAIIEVGLSIKVDDKNNVVIEEENQIPDDLFNMISGL